MRRSSQRYCISRIKRGTRNRKSSGYSKDSRRRNRQRKGSPNIRKRLDLRCYRSLEHY